MRDESPDHRDGGWVGESALILGVAAIVCAMLPVVSDFVAGPVAAIAIVLGIIGARWHQSGRARRVAPAIAGTVLGSIGLFVVVLMLAASQS